MLEKLDQQQREYAERSRLASQDDGPSPEEIISALFQIIDAEEESNASEASTPEELVVQTEKLLNLKGKRFAGHQRRIAGMLVGTPKPSYLEISYVKIEIGGREVDVSIGSPEREASNSQTPSENPGYGVDIGLHLGDDYEEISDALTIRSSGVETFDGKVLTAPNELRSVSRLLAKVDSAPPSEVWDS